LVEGPATWRLVRCGKPQNKQRFGELALKGAEFGWAKMLKQLTDVVAGLAAS